MVRHYKKTPGTRNYKNYSEETMEEALQKVTDGLMSIHAAATAYKIPYGTLYNRFKGMHGMPVGGQTIFTFEEERALLKSAATCSDWGFPLTTFDLRLFAKAYLDKQGKTINRFANNLPGVDWALSVLKRHKDAFGQKVSTNIKRARAKVDNQTLDGYFENLKNEVDGIPPSNIFNYDESNVSDDPGKKRCIYRRGVKYPERVMNHSKSCTTIMICGSADGTLLPPYVIYKAVHMYDTWKERGVVGKPCCTKSCCSGGSRYARTPSGWIDSPCFREWFTTIFLPHAIKLEGRKVIIGDNLSSHLDEDVIKLCEQHNIAFVCLVPNSTHLCQPLDVGFFRPMKMAWRKTLEDWKMTHLKAATVPKQSFPALLKEALDRMDQVPSTNKDDSEPSAIKRNLISSFKATGIYPWNKEKVLQKIPGGRAPETEGNENMARDVLTDFLKEKRFGDASSRDQPPRKRTRLQVEPGKSVSTVERPNEETTASNLVDSLQVEPGQSVSTVEKPHEETTASNQVDENDSDCDSDVTRCEGPEVGNFVLAKFASSKGKKTYQYVCTIEDVCDDKLVVKGLKSYRKKDKKRFVMVENDVSIIEESDIVMYLPKPDYNDEYYSFPSEVYVIEM